MEGETGGAAEFEHTPTFDELAGIWQSRLDEETDPEIQEEIARQAQSELDKNCPYFNQMIYFRGRGVVPEVDDLGNHTKDVVTDIDSMLGLHQGVYTSIVHPEVGPQINHYIETGERQISYSPTKVSTTQFFVNLFFKGASIVPIDDIESIYKSDAPVNEFESVQERLNTLDDYAKTASKFVRSTSFRRLPHVKQKQYLDAHLDEIRQNVDMVDKTVMAEPNYVYLPVVDNQRVNFVQTDVSHTIEGECLGVDSLDRLTVQHKAIRRDSDMLDKMSGICLVVDPTDDVRGSLGLQPEQIVFIPVGSQSFECIVIPDEQYEED